MSTKLAAGLGFGGLLVAVLIGGLIYLPQIRGTTPGPGLSIPRERLAARGFTASAQDPDRWTRENLALGELRSLYGFLLSDLELESGQAVEAAVYHVTTSEAACEITVHEGQTGELNDATRIRAVVDLSPE